MLLFNPKLEKWVDDAFDAIPPVPPAEWGEGWRWVEYSRKLDDTPEDEARRRWEWAKSAGLISQRYDENGNLFSRKNDPDWWEKAGEALALLRGEKSLRQGSDNTAIKDKEGEP